MGGRKNKSSDTFFIFCDSDNRVLLQSADNGFVWNIAESLSRDTENLGCAFLDVGVITFIDRYLHSIDYALSGVYLSGRFLS